MAITITDNAARKIKQLIKASPDIVDPDKDGSSEGYLRIKITSGGCSGLSYDMSIVNMYEDSDKIFSARVEEEGVFPENAPWVQVCIDPKSYVFVNGMILDYKESIATSGFVFDNPNVSQTCGCGKSFTV